MQTSIYQWIWVIPAAPLAGFLALAAGGRWYSRRLVAWLGALPTGLACLAACWLIAALVRQPSSSGEAGCVLWTWFKVGGVAPAVSLYADPLTAVFVGVVCFVGFLIVLYSTAFMEGDEGYGRFFWEMNLFIFSMLVLVMARDLLLLYLGWEGVGLSSFLLIGFWYRDARDAERNAYAARKAFLVTRIGDTALILGLFLLLKDFGTLDLPGILSAAPSRWQTGSSQAVWAAALLLGGAVGKSAQLPLSTWLPDAMAGPTPVSALIHAATMVTAGVYLIARTHVLFSLAPAVQEVVAILGAATLVVAAFSALAQRDIKRVLAYSTMSQIGYMFVALGVGAWSAAVFHFMIHAFFKALLFLAAGAVILALDHEQDMFRMGGLRKQLSLVYVTFLCGAGALAALPLVTAGFFSKDPILWFAYAAPGGSVLLWLAAFVSAGVTALYTFRMVFLTFWGPPQKTVRHRPGFRITFPLVVLAVLSVGAGWVEWPRSWGHFRLITGFLERTLPPAAERAFAPGTEGLFGLGAAIVALAGLYLAWQLYVRTPLTVYRLKRTGWGSRLYRLFAAGWYGDLLCDVLLVRPLVWLARVDKHDFIDRIYQAIGALNLWLGGVFGRTQQGRLRTYAMGVAVGAVILLTLMWWL